MSFLRQTSGNEKENGFGGGKGALKIRSTPQLHRSLLRRQQKRWCLRSISISIVGP